MTINEEKGNLFDLPSEYALVHCISHDCALGAGIAAEFERRFKIKGLLKEFIYVKKIQYYPHVIWTNTTGPLILNMITKEKYWHKPTRESFELALEDLVDLCEQLNVHKLGMPRIGCGLDRLQWSWVKSKIEEKFADTDIDIQVRYL